jgi:hypothetical protein
MSGISGINIPFSPTSIPGLSVWVDAADTTSFSPNTNGATITSLTDKASGTNYTIGGTPTYSTTGFAAPNGLSYPGFTMTNGRFIRALGTAFTTYRHTAFIVTDLTTFPGTTGFPCLALAGSTSGSDNFYRVLDYITTPNFRSIAFSPSLFQALGPTTISPFLFSSTFDGSLTIRSQSYVSPGNASGFGNPAGSGSAFTTNAGAVMIGTDGFTNQQNSNTWTGVISEVLIYGNTVLNPTQREQVEGYLARKWGMLTALPIAHPARNLSTLRFSPAAFDPLSIAGNVIWIDAADNSTITFSSGSNISQIVNKAPGATPAFAFGSPSLVTNSLNGRQSILMGTSNHLAGGATVSGNTVTCFAVAFTTAALPKVGPDQRLVSMVTSTSLDYDNTQAVIGLFNQQSSATIQTYRNFTSISAASISQNVPFLAGSIYNGTNGQLWKDGTAGSGPTASTGNFGIVKYSLGIQLNIAGNTEFWIGNIGEVLVYTSALTQLQRQQIEGYLAWKWGLETSLPSTHPNRSQIVFNPTSIPYTYPLQISRLASFQPTSVAGLEMWLDASTSFATSTNGATISEWLDLSTSGYIGAAVGSPTVIVGGIGGLNTVKFNGSSQYVNFGDIDDISTAQLFIFTVCKFDSTADGGIVSKYRGLSSPGRYFLLRDIARIGMGADATGTTVFTSFPDTSTTPQLITAVWNRSAIFIYQNGIFRNTVALVNSSALSNTNPFWVGALPNSDATAPQPGYFMNGRVGEVLLYYGSLTETQRQTIEGYLAWKWSMVGDLPANHPFKNYPPPP